MSQVRTTSASSKWELINEGFGIGVNETNPSVQAHVHHVTVKDIEAHKAKQEEVQVTEMEKTKEQHRERQVTLVRKPGPVGATFFRHIGKE